MRVIVCGDRNWRDQKFVWDMLFNLKWRGPGIDYLIEGGCRTPIKDEHGKVIGTCGVDYYANLWAAETKIPSQTMFANWHRYGPAAGPIRNGDMLKLRPDYVIAFPGGDGTANMKKQARRAGVDVVEIGRP